MLLPACCAASGLAAAIQQAAARIEMDMRMPKIQVRAPTRLTLSRFAATQDSLHQSTRRSGCLRGSGG